MTENDKKSLLEEFTRQVEELAEDYRLTEWEVTKALAKLLGIYEEPPARTYEVEPMKRMYVAYGMTRETYDVSGMTQCSGCELWYKDDHVCTAKRVWFCPRCKVHHNDGNQHLCFGVGKGARQGNPVAFPSEACLTNAKRRDPGRKER